VVAVAEAAAAEEAAVVVAADAGDNKGTLKWETLK